MCLQTVILAAFHYAWVAKPEVRFCYSSMIGGLTLDLDPRDLSLDPYFSMNTDISLNRYTIKTSGTYPENKKNSYLKGCYEEVPQDQIIKL